MRRSSGLYLPLIRAVRSISMILIAILLEHSKYAPIQVLSFMFISFALILYIANSRPFVERKRHNVELVNEAMVTMLSYFALIQLSDHLNATIGFCINLVIYIHVAINVIVIAVTTVSGLIHKLRKWMRKRSL